MSDATAHIDRWLADGLIDPATADRLRAAGVAEPAPVAWAQPAKPAAAEATERPVAEGRRSAAAAMFGPSVTIGEVFGYLGGGFLLGAWAAFMARLGSGTGAGTAMGFLALAAAIALIVVGIVLVGRSERLSRAAGVAFLVATGYVAGGVGLLASASGVDWPAVGIVAAAVALIAAIGLRLAHPAVLTQIAVLAWLTALVGSTLSWIQVTWFPVVYPGDVDAPAAGQNPLLLVVGTAVWWLATAVLIGIIGLLEADRAKRHDDPAAARRAATSRFWAGITAVAGLASAVTQSTYVNGTYSRVLEPWIGSLALLVLSAVLIERAFRRDATSFIYAAALGLIVALTSFNLSYLSDGTDVALLAEGLILLGVGYGADRLRRRIGGPRPPAADSRALESIESGEDAIGEPA
jgi:hypothetical protein